MASGLSLEMARNTIRLSVGRETSTNDVETAVADLRQSLNKIKDST
jgi:cysteine sulfinate desulfinase/cysteine desulfurase-like protein